MTSVTIGMMHMRPIRTEASPRTVRDPTVRDFSAADEDNGEVGTLEENFT